MKAHDIVMNKESTEFAQKFGFEKVLVADGKIVVGGTLEKNRRAVRSKNTKVLLDPASESREFDTAVAQIAKDNDVVIAFSISSLLGKRGMDRIRLLKNMQTAVEYCKKAGNQIMIISGARNKYEMRNPKTLVAFGLLLGLTKPQAIWAISDVYEGLI